MIHERLLTALWRYRYEEDCEHNNKRIGVQRFRSHGHNIVSSTDTASWKYTFPESTDPAHGRYVGAAGTPRSMPMRLPKVRAHRDGQLHPEGPREFKLRCENNLARRAALQSERTLCEP